MHPLRRAFSVCLLDFLRVPRKYELVRLRTRPPGPGAIGLPSVPLKGTDSPRYLAGQSCLVFHGCFEMFVTL